MKQTAIILICCLIVHTLTYAQSETQTLNFNLYPDKVQVYNSESDTQGFTLIDEFDDDFSLKLTNKLYKVNLFFKNDKMESLRSIIATFLVNLSPTKNHNKIVWKEQDGQNNPIFTIELVDNKVKIRIYRKNMSPENYAQINFLGKALIKEIKA